MVPQEALEPILALSTYFQRKKVTEPFESAAECLMYLVFVAEFAAQNGADPMPLLRAIEAYADSLKEAKAMVYTRFGGGQA